jgi:hypothetical protein
VENLKAALKEASGVIDEQHNTIEEMRREDVKLYQQPSVIGYYREKRAVSRDPGHET